jgi:NAD(P)-dependent dehydrogenase (short-subunit alcohol dehydrogenase family)
MFLQIQIAETSGQVKSLMRHTFNKSMTHSLRDKTILITGACSGIGLALSRRVVSRGARLIGIGHTRKRCETAADFLLEDGNKSRFVLLPSELSLMSKVRDLSVKIKDQLSDWGTDTLDALVLNAAAVPYRQIWTGEGLDTQWAVNYLSGFLLTHLLMAELARVGNARLISVSSDSHYRTRIRWHDLQSKRFYHPLLAYKQSKLAQVIFSVEFNRRLKNHTGITALVADPGLVQTGIGFKGNSHWMSFFWKMRSKNGQSPESAANDILFLLEEDDVLQSGHVYWKYRQPKTPNRFALNEVEGVRLWDISMKMAGLDARDSSL